MSLWHVKAIEAALHAAKWDIHGVFPGEARESERWQLRSRRYPGCRVHLVFEGASDSAEIPILAEAYACFVAEEQTINLYFSHSRKRWRKDISHFMALLENLGKTTKQPNA